MSARDELIEIVTRDPESSGGDEVWATDLVDAHAAEVRAATLREAAEELEADFPDPNPLGSLFLPYVGALMVDRLRALADAGQAPAPQPRCAECGKPIHYPARTMEAGQRWEHIGHSGHAAVAPAPSCTCPEYITNARRHYVQCPAAFQRP